MTQPPPVPAPPSGLGGKSNYILYSDCNPIVDLTVTINVTEDIVCQSTSQNPFPPCRTGSTPKGFAFQLNACSPIGETSAYQQYVIVLADRELKGSVNNWPSNSTTNYIVDQWFNLPSVPEATILPAGYQLKIVLRNNLWRTSWDLAVTGGWAGPADSGLLLYDPSSGTGAFYHIGHDGGMGKLAQYEDQPGWDLVVTGGWAGPGDSGLLIYNRFLGLAALYAITSDGGMTPLPGKAVGNTWDLAVTGGWAGPGNSGLLLYDQNAGVAAFYAVHSNGEMTLLRQYDDWRTSWDLAVTGGWAGPGNSGLLLYDRAAGTGAFYAVNSHGDMTLLEQYDASIAGANYIVTDNRGNVHEVDLILTSISGVNPADDLSPITAFQLTNTLARSSQATCRVCRPYRKRSPA